jgi:hypothetical protein
MHNWNQACEISSRDTVCHKHSYTYCLRNIARKLPTTSLVAKQNSNTNPVNLAERVKKKKAKFALEEAMKAQKESRDITTLPLTSALDWSRWLKPRPISFTPSRRTRYPLYRRPGGHQGLSRRVLKISPPQGFDPRIVQPVANHYSRLRYPGPQQK